jgi:hypothetical protein
MEAVVGNEIGMAGEIGAKEVYQYIAVFGDEGIDDGVPLLSKGSDGGHGLADNAGCGSLCALLEDGKLAKVGRVGDEDARGGVCLELAEQAIQVRGVLLQRHTALKVVADKPDGNKCGMVGESLWQLALERLVEGIATDAEIEYLRVFWQARDEHRDIALRVGVVRTDADRVRRADGDVHDRRVDGSRGSGVWDGAHG